MQTERDILDSYGLRRLKSSIWADHFRGCIENSLYMPSEAPEDVRREELSTQAVTITVAFLEEAARRCDAAGYLPGDKRASQIWDDLFEVGNRIAWNARPYGVFDDKKNWSVQWVQNNFRMTHRERVQDIVHLARQEKLRRVDTTGIEVAAGSYLASDVRLPDIDRLFVVALIESEVLAYFNEIYGKDILTGKDAYARSGLNRNVFGVFLLGRLLTALLLALVVGITFVPVYFDLLPLWVFQTALVLAVIYFVGDSIYAAWASAFAVPKMRAARQKWFGVGEELLSVLREFHTHGPMSVQRIRERLREAEGKGIVWPAALWAVLADIESRGIVVLTGRS